MPIGVELLLLIAALICAILSLAWRVPAGVAALLLCVVELLRLAGR